VHDFSGTTPGYFSLNGGATNLDNFNTNPNGDAGDWAGSAGHDSFLAFSSSGVVNAVSQTDVRLMNVLGYTIAQAPQPDLVISSLTPTAGTVSQGSLFNFSYAVTNIGTSAVTSSFWSTAFLDQKTIAIGSNQFSPLGTGSTAFANNSFSTTGLSVGQHTLWVEADSFNDGTGQFNSGNNDVAESNEVNNWVSITFTVTAPPDMTAPVLVHDNPLLDGVGKTVTISASSLAFSDPDNTDVQLTYTIVTGPAFGTVLKSGFATFSFTQADIDNGLIAYRQNGSNVSSDSFTFQVSDPAGNHAAAQSFQFQIAPVTVIEASGSTWLSQVGNQFYLYNSGGSGPLLKSSGAAVTAGEYGGWAPIGAEQTASGYEVAWKVTGADQYSVWSTDGNGNYITNVIGVVSGASATLEGFEPSFQQDLNGDGVIGVTGSAGATVIEAYGSTRLAQAGNQFLLSDAGGSGPVLKSGGAAVTAGEYGGWAPIGAEQTASGYEVAWKVTGADQYSVWNTDGNGNYITNVIGVVSGASATLVGF
jgi:hypothetical protein